MTDTIVARRRELARYLSQHGPTHGDALTAAFGLKEEAFWVLISCPWFDITGRGWSLTVRGEEEGLA